MRNLPFSIVVALAAAALASCQSAKAPSPYPPNLYGPGGPHTTPVHTGPVVQSEIADFYAEHPLLAFQRTGIQPAPLRRLPRNTPLQVLDQTGTFYRVQLNDGSVGYIATNLVTGVTTIPRPPREDPTPDPTPPEEPDTDQIDLDALP